MFKMNLKSLVVIFLLFVALALSKVKFTNFKCEVLDANFCNIPKCELKIIRRGVVALNVYVQLLEKPITNIMITASAFKKANGYRPYLYNKTINFCNFMKNKKKYPFMKIVHEMIENYSNLNHTCPYDHDIILENMVLKESMFKNLPLPRGEYMYQLIAYVSNEAKVAIKAYVQQTE